MTIGKGSAGGYLSESQVAEVVEQAAALHALDGKRVLVVIPDGTRTMPMPLMFRLLGKILRPRVGALDYLVALGTHSLMTDAELTRLVGEPVREGQAGETRVFNHHWENPANFAALGTIPAAEIREITGGALARDVAVGLNRLILAYDHLLICGPVFPHEVVGFSGGNKYFFPGIASSEIIHFTHWLGALITSYQVIGRADTPVRAVIDRAASLIPRPVSCFALVVTREGTAGIYFGEAPEAWRAAAELSAKIHVRYLERPFRQVLSVMPAMYRDIWTAAKGMYKVEPVVADGGEVILYSPQLDAVSYTHGRQIEEIGYHCRDYFVKQWSRFERYPWGVLAHSTHLKGLGEYDAGSGAEFPRIQVTLATRIPAETCRRLNLGYRDPETIRVDEWMGREDEGILAVPHAGEILYRLRHDPGQSPPEKFPASALAGAPAKS